MQLENAIQEAMAELDKASESRAISRQEEKIKIVNSSSSSSNGQGAKGSKVSPLITTSSKAEAKKITKKSAENSTKSEKKQCR